MVLWREILAHEFVRNIRSGWRRQREQEVFGVGSRRSGRSGRRRRGRLLGLCTKRDERDPASVVVVRAGGLQGVRQAGLHHRVRSAAPGGDSPPDGADLARSHLGAGAEGLEGRLAQDRLPVVRRLDRADRRLGFGEVCDERSPLCREPVGDRRRRNVQLRLREDHRADPEPGESGTDVDGQPGEHESGPDEEVGSG